MNVIVWIFSMACWFSNGPSKSQFFGMINHREWRSTSLTVSIPLLKTASVEISYELHNTNIISMALALRVSLSLMRSTREAGRQYPIYAGREAMGQPYMTR